MRPNGYLLPHIDPDLVLVEVARGFNLDVEEMMSGSKAKPLVTARACAITVLGEMTTLSIRWIADLFALDHTTVVHHMRSVRADPERFAAVRMVIDELSSRDSQREAS